MLKFGAFECWTFVSRNLKTIKIFIAVVGCDDRNEGDYDEKMIFLKS